MRWLLGLLVACAPVVDGPADKQRVIDRGDGDRLAVQLGSLPGVVRSDVIVTRPVSDPLSPISVTTAPTASIVVIIDDQVTRDATAATVQQLAATALPGVAQTVVVQAGAVRPVMAKLGPFTVEASSKQPLKIALAIAFALLATLAGWIAWRTRPIRSDPRA